MSKRLPKEPIKDDHQALSRETINKLLNEEEEMRLDPFEVLHLERTERVVVERQAMVTELNYKMELLKAHFERQMAQARHDDVTARTALSHAQDAHRKLAESLATHYGFSWQTHAYNPDTGVVTRTD